MEISVVKGFVEATLLTLIFEGVIFQFGGGISWISPVSSLFLRFVTSSLLVCSAFS